MIALAIGSAVLSFLVGVAATVAALVRDPSNEPRAAGWGVVATLLTLAVCLVLQEPSL